MPKTSPYFTFVHYYRDGERKKGRHLSLEQAKAEADPVWASLPGNAREKFVEMAEDKGRYYARRKQPPPASQMSQSRVQMRGLIEKVLAMADNVRTHPFHFISFYRGSNGRLPSEISVLRFSIERGAENFLHFLLNPDMSPRQYELLSEKMSQPVTVIPIEDTPNSKENLEEVWNAILVFSGGVVFTMTNENHQAIQSLGELQRAYPKPTNPVIPLDGEELIEILWERSREGHEAQLIDVRETCSRQTGLDHLACEFHKVRNDEGVCTLWKPYRLAYGLSALLAKPYDMEIAEGYHRLRKNWIPVGTYFSGKGSYEPWHFPSSTTSWDSQKPSSSASVLDSGMESFPPL